MFENYLIKGLIIGIVFGVPAGVVGVLSIQRNLSYGVFAGIVTGLGSSTADVFYVCVGVFGMSVISDFLLKHQRLLCIGGCLAVSMAGIHTFRKKEKKPVEQPVGALMTDRFSIPPEKSLRKTIACFFSALAIAMTNPAAILSFMVVFSMFQINGAESVGENIQLVFGIFCGTCIWWFGIAAAVSLFRNRITDEIYIKLNRTFGVLMVLFGAAAGLRGVLV